MYMLGAGAEPTANLAAMAQQRGFASQEAQARAMATIKQAKIEAASRMQALGLTNQNEEANRALERYRIDGSQENLRQARLYALGIHDSDAAREERLHASDAARQTGQFNAKLAFDQSHELNQANESASKLDADVRAHKAALALQTEAQRTNAEHQGRELSLHENQVNNSVDNIKGKALNNIIGDAFGGGSSSPAPTTSVPTANPTNPFTDSPSSGFTDTLVGPPSPNTPSNRPNPVPPGVDPNSPPSWAQPKMAPTSGPDSSDPTGGVMAAFARSASSDLYPKPPVPAASVPPAVRKAATTPPEWGTASGGDDALRIGPSQGMYQSPAPSPSSNGIFSDADKRMIGMKMMGVDPEAHALDIKMKQGAYNESQGEIPAGKLALQNKALSARATAIAQQKYNDYRLSGSDPIEAKTRAIMDANQHPELAGMPGFTGLDPEKLQLQEPFHGTTREDLDKRSLNLTGKPMADYVGGLENDAATDYNRQPAQRAKYWGTGLLGIPARSLGLNPVDALWSNPVQLDVSQNSNTRKRDLEFLHKSPAEQQIIDKMKATGFTQPEIDAYLKRTVLSRFTF